MQVLKGKDILHGSQFAKKETDAIIEGASYFEKELKKSGKKAIITSPENLLKAMKGESGTTVER